jgi:hypothetical protein
MVDERDSADGEALEQVVDAVEKLAARWAQDIDLASLVRASALDPDSIADLCRQAFIEGAYQGLQVMCNNQAICSSARASLRDGHVGDDAAMPTSGAG